MFFFLYFFVIIFEKLLHKKTNNNVNVEGDKEEGTTQARNDKLDWLIKAVEGKLLMPSFVFILQNKHLCKGTLSGLKY